MNLKNLTGAIIAILICEAAGGIGAIFTTPAINGWYASLVRPSIAPPNWVFGPVWTTLFAFMGIALYIVWKNRKRLPVKSALGIFALQLVLNVLWSVLFFGLHSPLAALIEIAFLWLAILATIISFARISKTAAVLLVPYICWVSFAAYLTYSYFVLN